MTQEITKVDQETSNISLNNLKLPRSDKEDIVDDIFKIHLNEEIHELSNKFCKYYYASNIDDESMFFAIVYEPSFVVPIKTIDSLLKNPISGVNEIISWSVVKISSNGAEHLVIIVNSYDYNNNLFTYIQKNGPISSSSNEKIILNLTNVIHTLSLQSIYGYNISPSNILMDNEGNFLSLREFVNSYSYFHEENQYIAPELIECLQASRRTQSCKQDIYALGISIFYSFSGQSPWTKFLHPEEYNENRFEHSSYKYLMNKLKTSERLRNFLRFALHDDATIRWGTRQIYDWLDGKTDKIVYDSLSSNKYTIGFNDRNYSNPKSLSYAMFRFWEQANKFIRDTKLLQWAGKQQLSNEALTSIKYIIDARSSDSVVAVGTNPVTSNQKLSKLLSILDPNGGLRHETIAVSAESIPESLQYLQTSKRKILVEQLIKIMKDESWKYYSNNDSVGLLEETRGNEFRYLAAHNNQTSPYKNNERLIYSLNPALPCLSPTLDGKYVTNIKELLTALESYSQKKPNSFGVDRHIIAFIAAKLDLKDDVKAVILSNFPKFAEHHAVSSLSVINLLHQHEPDIKITNICKSISLELAKVLDQYLHNVEFKKNVLAKIETVAHDGNISNIIAVFSNQQQFIDDYSGYYEACKKAKYIEQQISTLSSQTDIFNGTAILLGQKTTVLASYILCLIAIVTIII